MKEIIFFAYFITASVFYGAAALIPELSQGLDPMFKLVMIGLLLVTGPSNIKAVLKIVAAILKK